MLSSGCIRRGNLDRNITTRLLIPGQPDGRVAPKAKLVDDAITPVAERDTNANRVKFTRLVVQWILDVLYKLDGVW